MEHVSSVRPTSQKIPRKSEKSTKVGPELIFVLFLDYHLQCICGGLIVDFWKCFMD